MSITLFKSENCSACKAIQKDLDNRNVAYTIETSLEVAAELGIRAAPALIIKQDGNVTVLRQPKELVAFIKAI